MLGYFAQLAFISGEDPPPMGSSHPNIVPYGSFPASDGSIIIAVLSESFWGKLCEALGRPELATDPRFATPTLRRDRRDEVDQIISDITRTRTVAEWEARLKAADVPHAPIKFPGAPQPPVTAPPTFGQHTVAVLRDELGYGDAEIDKLRKAGVIDRRREPRG
jgi:crotonobetainyl-CoA:carnitine CoA-transferase CaiB-like acyl-CoA transferase